MTQGGFYMDQRQANTKNVPDATLASGGTNETTYPFSAEQERMWNMHGLNLATDTPYAKAWARLHDRGIVLGPPVFEAFNRESDGKTVMVFNGGYCEYDNNTTTNPNMNSVFFDARGVVGTESGL